MVTRGLAVLLAALLAACTGAPAGSKPAALVLHGFRLVDPGSQSVREADVVIEGGVVVAQASAAAEQRVIEGHGRWLLPALWDVKASLWGNNSTLDYKVLEQEVSFTRSLKIQLYYGVAHVAVFGMERDWVERELKRAAALEMAAAEPFYGDKALCAKNSFACLAVPNEAVLSSVLATRKAQGAPLLQLFYGAPQTKDDEAGVSETVLRAALPAAERLGLASFVFVDDWAAAATAVAAGAQVIYGFPEGLAPDSLVTLMLRKRTAYAPALVHLLELERLLANEAELGDPFIAASVTPEVRASFRSEKELWLEWRPDLERGRKRQRAGLEALRLLSKAGVSIVSASDAGWSPGAFQGYATHAAQAWLERAGVEPWSRLAAVTSAPARVLGRNIGFHPGDPADYLALDADPLAQAANLRRISFLLRHGTLVDRPGLLPDLTRSKFVP
jgi:hypothetical protein